MTPPSVLVNTYIQVNGKPTIDRVSKLFIICEMPLGIIRLPLLGVHPLFTMVLVLYALGVAAYLIHFCNAIDEVYLMDVAVGSSVFQCFFFMAFNLISIKRLQRYYNELNVFDKEVGCIPRLGKGTIRNIIQTLFMAVYVCVILALPYIFTSLSKLYAEFIPIISCHILEVHYIGHLLSLLIPRLRLINYCMELSLVNTNITKTTKVEEFGFISTTGNKALCKMEKLMNLYHTVIKAYNFLVEAIKWQLLMTIIASFLSILCYCYHVSYALIKEQGPISFASSCLGLSVGIMLPLFAPCTLGDQVHNEVRRLRELLASRLYENQMGTVKLSFFVIPFYVVVFLQGVVFFSV